MDDYIEIIKTVRRKSIEIEGKILSDFLIDIVEPEFNIAYLIFNDSVYAINGALGSEIISITQVNKNNLFAEGRKLKRFGLYSEFLNRKIFQVRNIGEEWNGHGIEISFEGIYNKSMIIQSIYAGEKPDGFDDCIRLGIGQYYYSSDSLNPNK